MRSTLCRLLAVITLLPLSPSTLLAREPISLGDRISAMIGQNMEYPPDAFRDNDEGLVRVAFTIGRGGTAERIRVIGKSGSRQLDRAAVKTIAELHDLPAEASGRSIVAIVQYGIGNGSSLWSFDRQLQLAAQRERANLEQAFAPEDRLNGR